MEDKEKVITVENVLTEQEAFAKLIDSGKKRTFYARITGICMIIICIVVVIAGVLIIPRAINAIDEAQTTILMAEESLKGLDELSDQLTTTAESMNTVIEANASGLADALEEINNIDIDTLNSAIKNLSDTVEPMAKFFNRFK